MDYAVVSIAALLVAALTLFSGFGLGTLLMPVFAFFFPVEVAVALTAIVHAANNAFKVPLFARRADRSVILRFGLPAIVAAFAGSALLTLFSELPALATYQISGHQAVVTPVKAMLALLIFGFSLFELVPRLRDLEFDPKYLSLGGLLSGFFGGLSGHQGALRSAFLVKTGLPTERFVATSAMIAFLVDLARLSVYGAGFLTGGGLISRSGYEVSMALAATFAAFLGTFFGKRYIGKVTMQTVQIITGLLLVVVAVLLGSGLI